MTVTRKLRPGMTREAARQGVRDLWNWKTVAHDSRLLDRAWALEDRFDLAWRDATVVAAALQADCRVLLSEDFQDGMTFEYTTVVNPFEHESDAVLRL